MCNNNAIYRVLELVEWEPKTRIMRLQTDINREELRLLYQVSINDIAFFKRNQWSATNYTLAIHAAVILISYQILKSPLDTLQLWVLIVLAWSASVGGLAVVWELQESIRGRRTRLRRVRRYFGRPFKNAWSIPKPPDNNYWLLMTIMVVAAAIVTWLILLKV